MRGPPVAHACWCCAGPGISGCASWAAVHAGACAQVRAGRRRRRHAVHVLRAGWHGALRFVCARACARVCECAKRCVRAVALCLMASKVRVALLACWAPQPGSRPLPTGATPPAPPDSQDGLQEVLPKAGLVVSEKGNLTEVLCKVGGPARVVHAAWQGGVCRTPHAALLRPPCRRPARSPRSCPSSPSRCRSWRRWRWARAPHAGTRTHGTQPPPMLRMPAPAGQAGHPERQAAARRGAGQPPRGLWRLLSAPAALHSTSGCPAPPPWAKGSGRSTRSVAAGWCAGAALPPRGAAAAPLRSACPQPTRLAPRPACHAPPHPAAAPASVHRSRPRPPRACRRTLPRSSTTRPRPPSTPATRASWPSR